MNDIDNDSLDGFDSQEGFDVNIVGRIRALFDRHGHRPYDGSRREPVSALQHALQCAQLAEWADADLPMVGAALLHDIGHLQAADEGLPPGSEDDIDDGHELRAVPLLQQGFGADLVEPVRLHVAAKRYLVRVDTKYAQGLSSASQLSLVLQGGPMRAEEASAFERQPFAMEAVRLRRWDDLAKVAGKQTPPLDYYLALLQELLQQPLPTPAPRTAIGSPSAT